MRPGAGPAERLCSVRRAHSVRPAVEACCGFRGVAVGSGAAACQRWTGSGDVFPFLLGPCSGGPTGLGGKSA